MEEFKKKIKKNEEMINRDPVAMERKTGKAPGIKYLESKLKETFTSFFPFREGMNEELKKEVKNEMKEEIKKEVKEEVKQEVKDEVKEEVRKKEQPGEKGVWGKIGGIVWDTLVLIAKIGLSIYISSYWLQVTRAYKEDRMVPGISPSRTPYTPVGAAKGEDKYKISILSSKRFGFPYTLRNTEQPDSWRNGIVDLFRDNWIYAKKNADYLIGILEPASFVSDTKDYKNKEEDILYNLCEAVSVFYWIPFLVTIVALYGMTIAPFYTYLKSLWTNIVNQLEVSPINIIPLLIFAPIVYISNAITMPLYVIYFMLFRGYNYMRKGGIKDWAQHYIGKYYLLIFIYVIAMITLNITNVFSSGETKNYVLYGIGAVTAYLLVLAYFGYIPSSIGAIDSAGRPVNFRVPGGEKLNTLLYPRPAKPSVAQKVKSAGEKGLKIAKNVIGMTPKGAAALGALDIVKTVAKNPKGALTAIVGKELEKKTQSIKPSVKPSVRKTKSKK